MKSFSHVSNFPGYMHRVRDILQSKGKSGQRVLDMPAGSGKFGGSLKALGKVDPIVKTKAIVF
jgi:hypothetical protein